MADTKLTALSAFTPVRTDLLYGVDDPGGTPASGKLTIADALGLVTGSDVALTDAGGWFTTDNAEAALQEAAADIDNVNTRLGTVEGSYLTVATVPVSAFDAEGNASAARPTIGADVIIWYNTPSKPTNLGANDIWPGIPGTEYVEKTASYTAVITDADIAFGMNLTSTANNFTIPKNSAVAFVVGTKMSVTQIGTGVTTIQGVDTDVTINGSTSGTVVLERWQTATAHKIASDTWVVTVSEPGTGLKDSDIGVTVQGYDADTLKADTADQLTAGFTAAVDDDGTQSTGTYTPAVATGNFKQITNGGAFTLAPPSPANDEAIALTVLIINNGSAGTITTSGFTAVKGDSFTTTDTHKFLCHIDVYDDGGTEYSVLQVVALQ